MISTLSKRGDSYVLLIERALAEQAGFDEQTMLEVAVVGSTMIVSPLKETNHEQDETRPRQGPDLAHNVLRRLAE